MPISQAVLSKYPNTIFIETGTYTGSTTAMALRCGFERVLTVELSDYWRDQYQTLFGNDDRVQLFASSPVNPLFMSALSTCVPLP